MNDLDLIRFFCSLALPNQDDNTALEITFLKLQSGTTDTMVQVCVLSYSSDSSLRW